MKLKHVPEDFIVEEIPIKDWMNDGEFSIFKLSKTDMNTEHSIEIISKKFNIPTNLIKYSGTKDRHAKTVQYISIPKKILRDKNISIKESDLFLEHAGFNSEPLSLGTLKGNNFEIILRELSSQEEENILNINKYLKENSENKNNIFVPNYFDEQRFSKNNYNIGLSIILGKYKEAVDIICSSSESFAEKTSIYLSKNKNDYIGALKNIPKKILLMFIHSVQSYIYNESIYRILLNYAKENNIPYYEIEYSLGKLIFYSHNNIANYKNIKQQIELIGFNTSIESIEKYIREVFNETGLSPRNFIIRSLPDLSVEGTLRNSFVKIENLEIELNEKEKICKLKFFLEKGSYATIVIKGLVNN